MTLPTSGSEPVTIAANNGDIAGGEVMLLNIARACEELGVDTAVVGPSHPSDLVDAARDAGHRTVVLEANGRKEWMRSLRRWDRTQRGGLLWCNGLVPSLATAGHPGRIVHVHSTVPPARRAMLSIARRGALATLVPSASMRRDVRGADVFPNWVLPIERRERERRGDGTFVLGFLGRVSVDKGVPILAAALGRLEQSHPGRFRLLLAGDPRFVPERDQRAVEDALVSVEGLVERTGWIAPGEFFARVDLIVCPSVWPEPFGLVAAEAMATRTPLLVSDAGALPEVVGRDESVIVPAGDVDALAAAILDRADGVIDTSASVRSGWDRWEKEYSPEAGVNRTRQLLTGMGRTQAAVR
ncbi:glycosyltransferase family 4 protein [Microbacterium allomyrinae]|uniref:Glycosyltransferase family 4 protein n=1 Tax=Microbacterium allomyrinae TaxID=2830666 RepID=A0A9X1LSH7_9MICO|nr:glycosyltransferase family 4 protein [Microbacterium allomyrinae]MCC2030740.1 glycosyltransferase family 4 protein [Microbacterium allomyrinae]